MIHLEVAVAAPVASTLTYSFPAASSSLQPGIRLLVPLGRRQVTGYLLGLSPPGETTFKIRQITDLLDRTPLFPENMIPFFRWMASYYRYPLGEVIKNALPGGLTCRSERTVHVTESGKTALKELTEDTNSPAWIAELLQKGCLSPARVRALRRSKKWLTRLEKWQAEGFIKIEESISSSLSKPKTEIGITPAEEDQSTEEPGLKPSEQKTLALLRQLIARRSSSFVPRKELNRLYSGAGKALKSLAEKKLISISEQQVFRDPFGEEPPFYPEPAQLTTEQITALDALLPAIENKNFVPFLLHGITGSGKTEVYLRAAEKALALNRSVLVLVPEIALASQLEAHFFSRFGKKLALLHSGLSQGERYDQWRRIMDGKAKIVIGARSAIFAPLEDPGLIIVDEEHDSAYKQEDNLRYQGRDMAVLRAKLQGCPVLLGSATPSLTTYHNSTTGKYRTLSLTKRIEERPLPKVNIVDLRLINKTKTAHFFFSQELLDALRETLEQGDQSIIFLNRRGYASLMICRDCGSPVQCLHCNISLTLHKAKGILCCHHCGYTIKSAIICPSCRSNKVREVGFGTEKIEEALGRRFPKARIARLDRDTSTSRKNFLATLKAVHNREIDILVGTQMITKGHHFPHVTLVGVIWADAGLGIPDFKAGERTFQIITQVTGRSGRGDKPGRVIIQTHQPDHYAITCAENHDYQGFFDKEMSLRQALSYPPFSRLVVLRFSGEKEKQVKEVARRIGLVARKHASSFNIEILGPASAPLSKIRNKYRWQILMKGSDSTSLHSLCDLIEIEAPTSGSTSPVHMTVDIDPENML